MSLEEKIRPISWVKANATELLEHVNRTHQAVIITQKGKPRAVLQDAESYESMRKALLMLKLVAQGQKEIREGKVVPQAEAFRMFRRRLNRKTSK